MLFTSEVQMPKTTAQMASTEPIRKRSSLTLFADQEAISSFFCLTTMRMKGDPVM